MAWSDVILHVRLFVFFTDQPQNPWQMLVEFLGSAEPRLKITAVVFMRSFFSIFYAESSYCFQRVLAIAILSVRLSFCLSVTRVDQSKMVQARITKSSPSAAWKTLVSGTVKFFHKFECGHPE